MVDRESALEQHYDAVAEAYAGMTQQIDAILSRLPVESGKRMIDVGCGPGNLLFRIPNIATLGEVVGTDISEGVLSFARHRAQHLNLPNAKFVRASACSLPLPDAHFDVVVSNMVLHLVGDWRQALTEMRRVLRPGGRAIIQFQGGGEVARETVGLLRQAWTAVLPGRPFPVLFDTITVPEVAQHLQALGLTEFELDWRRVCMKIPPAKLGGYLKGFGLVAGFWRCGVGAEEVSRIEDQLAREVTAVAQRGGFYTNTGNMLLIDFKNP
jgi:SAM-dependent methyltransferase